VIHAGIYSDERMNDSSDHASPRQRFVVALFVGRFSLRDQRASSVIPRPATKSVVLVESIRALATPSLELSSFILFISNEESTKRLYINGTVPCTFAFDYIFIVTVSIGECTFGTKSTAKFQQYQY
jgi:hypothetical protein